MQTRAQIYRSIRQPHLAIPALAAWRQAAFNLEIDRWVDQVGFSWDAGPEPRTACWFESGYTLEARIEIDEAGWDLIGVDDLGHFTNTWEPGAIEHDRFKKRVLDWFVPADADHAQALYKRACRYGDDWVYVVLSVRAIRADVTLGEAVLCGIDSDAGDRYFTETVFDLTHEAIQSAGLKIRELCGEC